MPNFHPCPIYLKVNFSWDLSVNPTGQILWQPSTIFHGLASCFCGQIALSFKRGMTGNLSSMHTSVTEFWEVESVVIVTCFDTTKRIQYYGKVIPAALDA